MPGTIRLNKVLKELNISIDRAVDFLNEKGIDVERRPTTKIDKETYDILIKEFHSDAKERAASEEVILNKLTEKKSESDTKEEEIEDEPVIIRAKDNKIELEGVTTVGKINLEKETETPKEEKPVEETKPEVKIPEKEIIKKPVVKRKIELPEKEKPKPKESKEPKEQKEPKKEVKTEVKEKKPVENKPKKEKIKEVPIQAEEPKEPEKIETQYQKLEGLSPTGKTIDLSQFEKEKKKKEEPASDNKKKRKRIRKNVNISEVKQDNNRNSGNKKRPGNKSRRAVVELTDEEVSKQIKETLEKLTSKGKGSKAAKYRRDKRRDRREQEALDEKISDQEKTLHVTEFVTVNELASLMDVSVTDIISAYMSLGVMVTMNQRLEADTIQLVASDFGYEVEFTSAEEEIGIVEEEFEDNPDDLKPRAPIVTVMGHVDHGKTSLLDHIRSANVIAGESGGITQHIGAYNVQLKNGKNITFLDTPGHEAFTAMRARGTQLTDLAIIVIAADDQVMPQTKEAISHAQAAQVPIIFAINKIDKPSANPDKVKEQLAAMNLLVEDWGGNIQSEEISARQGTNVRELLEKVLLEAEILELKANPKRPAVGTVVEASLDKGRGYVSTVLVQNGTLKVGDYLLAGSNHGKVRAMLDERGKNVSEAGPSMPVTILGLDGAPTAGDNFRVYEDEREAKQIALRRGQLQREQTIRTQKHITLDEIGRRITLGDFKELNIILKGDVDGSVEALTDSLQELSTEEIQINMLFKGVGPITESDVLLASASDAIIIGFNVRPGTSAKDLALREEIEIRTYSIIYDAINDVKEAMEGMLSPELKEQITGNIEIRETFKVSKVGTIAGCMVLDGKVNRNSKIRLIREGVVIFDGELASLKRFKDDVKEVTKGYECGLSIKNYNDIRIGDIVEAYETIEVKKKLK